MTRSRPYSNANDLVRLQHYNAKQIARDPCGWLHPGDIACRLMTSSGRGHDPANVLRLWEDDAGEVVGWASFVPKKGFDLQSHDARIIVEALAWLTPQLTTESIELYDDDAFRKPIFTQHGFAPDPNALPFALTHRSLDDLPAVPAIPDGFSIRAAAGMQEVEALAAVHSGMFGAPWTAAEYARVMESPGYAAEREFVVVAPDGRLAAFAVTWHDTLNRLGYFEPVGTHADFRRLGLARAVMTYAMHRMRDAGMTQVWVLHEAAQENPASAALYASLGFRRQYSTRMWSRS